MSVLYQAAWAPSRMLQSDAHRDSGLAREKISVQDHKKVELHSRHYSSFEVMSQPLVCSVSFYSMQHSSGLPRIPFLEKAA